MSIITLLTDFGTRDEYVGLMKGVILSVHPSATIVDITHQIDSQDIEQAAHTIHAAYRYFPVGSVHLVVVDPGVGTERALLALEMQKQIFIAPDNGVLSLLFDEEAVGAIIKITNVQYFLETISQTFHGRDIIAPVGAHIARGVELRQLGDRLELAQAVRLPNIYPKVTGDGKIIGKVVAIDHFGNLISNIDRQMLPQGGPREPKKPIRIRIGSLTIDGIDQTYGDGRPNAPLALIGSRGYLEIAVPGGSAAEQLKVCKGDRVQLTI